MRTYLVRVGLGSALRPCEIVVKSTLRALGNGAKCVGEVVFVLDRFECQFVTIAAPSGVGFTSKIVYIKGVEILCYVWGELGEVCQYKVLGDLVAIFDDHVDLTSRLG